MRGIPYGLNAPYARAHKAITGQENYYRWGMGASGWPASPLMVVQQAPFTPTKAPEGIKNDIGSTDRNSDFSTTK